MKRVSYAGGTFVSGDRIVDAVTRFATANANAARSAEIEIPAAAARLAGAMHLQVDGD